MTDTPPDRRRTATPDASLRDGSDAPRTVAAPTTNNHQVGNHAVAGIPAAAMTFRFVRSSGPGGQNVNKVSTAVQLRVDLAAAGLPSAVRARLERNVPGQVTREGELIIMAQRFRSQLRNREDALERLAALVREARQTPRPRIATRPSLAEKRRRRAAKQQQADRKQMRRKPPTDS